ncbi:hypothetical protein SBA6_480033 [Candidatus Sulfopaludibacter sp. SbA6]|nr:hypothetical protein SBA6_480033 [Candidatus Sulfopaludibacter sp. SbA6]
MKLDRKPQHARIQNGGGNAAGSVFYCKYGKYGVTDEPSVWLSAMTTLELLTLNIWASALTVYRSRNTESGGVAAVATD